MQFNKMCLEFRQQVAMGLSRGCTKKEKLGAACDEAVKTVKSNSDRRNEMADMMSMMTPAAAAPAPKKATKKKAAKKKTAKKKAAPKKKAAKKTAKKKAKKKADKKAGGDMGDMKMDKK